MFPRLANPAPARLAELHFTCTSAVSYKSSPHRSPSCSSLARPLARRTCRLRHDAAPFLGAVSATTCRSASSSTNGRSSRLARTNRTRLSTTALSRAPPSASAANARGFDASVVGRPARRPTPSRDDSARAARPSNAWRRKRATKGRTLNVSRRRARSTTTTRTARDGVRTERRGANPWERVVGEGGDDDELRMRFVDNTNESARATANSKDWRRRG